MLTIKQLATLSGVTTRTLRHYDEIGLFQPVAHSESGYRLYDEQQSIILQQILLYRQMGLTLSDIAHIVHATDFDVQQALEMHLAHLQQEVQQLQQKMQTVEKTLRYVKGEITMTANEQFEGFKQQQLAQNEARYGQEIRAKYGEESVKAAYNQYKNLTPQQFEGAQNLENQLFTLLGHMLEQEDAETLLEIAELHKRWLSMYWPTYTKEAHKGLAEMYIADERFTAYYDERVATGATQLLYKAIAIYTA